MPFISVIMAIYNTNDESMVKLAIDSVLNQTFKEFEFIICDDGSTDGTYELVNKLVRQDQRVVLIRNDQNMGLAASLNHCLEIAKGDYIARMDADDISLPSRLYEEVGFLERNLQYAFIGCCAYLLNKNEIWGKRLIKEQPEVRDFLFGSPFIHPTVLFRRNILMDAGGYRVSKETLRAEDYDLFMRLYAQGYKAYNLQKCLYQFREDNNAYKRRSYKYRLGEARVRRNGFISLKLMPIGIFYILKPLIIGLLPQKVLALFRKESI